MPAPRKYPQELRERSVRLVREAMSQEASLSMNAAVIRMGHRVGVNSDTVGEAGPN
jgi:transposase